MSGRDTTAAFKAEIANNTINPVLLFDTGFTAGTVYTWNGIGDISWNGNTYSGFGNTLAISEVVETTELKAASVTVSFEALTSVYKALALSSVNLKGDMTIRLGLLDNTGALIADPEVIFAGKMDSVEIEEGGEYSTFKLNCENRLILLNRANERRYTDQDQKEYQSGDTSLRHTVNVNRDTKWGTGWVHLD